MIESGRKPSEAIAAMKQHLAKRGRSALLPKIAHALVRLAARQKIRTTMTLSIARLEDAKRAIKKAENVLAQEGVPGTDLCEEVDEALIGGWRLEGRGILVDRSWKRSLLSMYNRATR